MKFITTTFLTLAIGVGVLQAQVANTPATLYLKQGGNPQGYITASAPAAIKFATTQTSPARVIQLSEIKGTGLEKGISLGARSEVLADSRAAFSSGNYLVAARGVDGKGGFAKIVNDYQQLILNIPQNFASEAMFYQIESYRRIGNYKAVASLLKTPAGKSMDKVLSDRYKNSIRMQKLWAVYGSGDIAAVEAALESYQAPAVGKAGLLPARTFNKMPQSEFVQLAFMRAKIFESKGEKDKALEDYFRVFSLAFANEPFLSKQAMGASMVIQSENPKLKAEEEKIKKGPLRQLQSVAWFFSKRFPDTTMPAQFQEYAVMPEVDVMVVKSPEPASTEAPAAEGDPKPTEAKEDGPAPSAQFVKLDTNKDGKLSEKEFLASEFAKKQGAKKAKRTFKARDKDKNGSLSPEEQAAKMK